MPRALPPQRSDADPAERRWRMGVFDAIRFMNPEALAQALEEASPDARLIGGQTPLTMCVHYSDGEGAMIDVLLDAGARIDLPDGDGMTALGTCLDRNEPGLALRLLERGAKISGEDDDGDALLARCCRLGLFELVPPLLRRGADPVLANFEGGTALMALCGRRRFDGLEPERWAEAAKALLDAGADIDAIDDSGWSPLSHAAKAGDERMVQWLIDFGASQSAAPGRSSTPAQVARIHGHGELADSMERQRARSEREALDTASDQGSPAQGPSSNRL